MKKSLFLSLAVAGALLGGAAVADSHVYPANNPKWKAECGSCHVAYPPQLLPASSWRALMSGLEKHFGTDAGLDPRTAAEIGAFLERNAGRERSPSRKPVLRITETRWFVHEHDEISGSPWKKVKTPANCVACHSGAENGDYRESNLRIPK